MELRSRHIPGLMERELEALIAWYEANLAQATILGHNDAVRAFKTRITELKRLLP